MSTSTIQIKRGTGSAVPSGLTDGELAINLDSGRLYYGSGSNSVDSYTFTHVTASGNISASGFGSFTGDIIAGGEISASGDLVGDKLNIGGIVGAVRTTNNDTGNLYAASGINTLNLGKLLHLTTTNIVGSLNMSQPDAGHITASGNISASGDIIAHGGLFANLPAGTDSSVVVYDNGQLKTDEVDAKIFSVVIGPTGGGNLGSGTNSKFMFIDDGDSNTVDGGNLKNMSSPVGVEVLGHLSASTGEFDHRVFDTGSATLGSDGGSIGDIVKFGGTSTTAGHLYVLSPDGTWANTNASGSNIATGSLAVALGANSTTNGMLLKGMTHLSTDPSAGIGSPVFLSTQTNKAQAVAPSASGDFVRIIGHQFGPDLIYFNPSPDFIKVS